MVAPQAFPFLEFASYSATRAGGASYQFAAEGSLSPKLMVVQWFPFFYGDPAQETFWATTIPYMEISSYLSVFALGLILVTVLAPSFRELRFWWILMIGSMLVALGEYTPLHRILYTCVPGWDHFRNPGRALVVTNFCGCLLAGFGIERLKEITTSLSDKTWRRIIYFFLTLFISVLFTAGLVGLYEQRILESFARVESATRAVFNEGIRPYVDPTTYQSRFDAMSQALWVGAGYQGLFFAILAIWTWQPQWGKKLVLLMITFSVIDLLIFGNRFLQAHSQEEWRKEFFPDSKVMQAVTSGGVAHEPLSQHQPGMGRLLITDLGLDWRFRKFHPETFPNGPMRYKVRSVRGYSPSILKHFSEFINLAQGRPANQLPGGLLFLDEIPQFDPLALQVMGVTTVMTYQAAPVTALRERDQLKPRTRCSSGMMLFDHPAGLPRCFRARPTSNLWGMEPIARANDETIVRELNPNRIEVTTRGNQAEWLVFADSWFPGWRVSVNGKRESVHKAFHTFQAVAVPAGSCQVVWEFSPTGWRLYLALSVLGILLTGLCLCSELFVRKSPSGSE
jgi:hypothetical protein